MWKNWKLLFINCWQQLKSKIKFLFILIFDKFSTFRQHTFSIIIFYCKYSVFEENNNFIACLNSQKKHTFGLFSNLIFSVFDKMWLILFTQFSTTSGIDNRFSLYFWAIHNSAFSTAFEKNILQNYLKLNYTLFFALKVWKNIFKYCSAFYSFTDLQWKVMPTN